MLQFRSTFVEPTVNGGEFWPKSRRITEMLFKAHGHVFFNRANDDSPLDGDTQIFSAGQEGVPEGFVDPDFPPNKESMGPKVSCYCEPNGYKVPRFLNL